MAEALYCRKGTAKVWLGSYRFQKRKIRYVWGFNLFKMLKYVTAGVLYCWKIQNKVLLRYGWGLIVFKKLI